MLTENELPEWNRKVVISRSKLQSFLHSFPESRFPRATQKGPETLALLGYLAVRLPQLRKPLLCYKWQACLAFAYTETWPHVKVVHHINILEKVTANKSSEDFTRHTDMQEVPGLCSDDKSQMTQTHKKNKWERDPHRVASLTQAAKTTCLSVGSVPGQGLSSCGERRLKAAPDSRTQDSEELCPWSWSHSQRQAVRRTGNPESAKRK